MSYHRRLCPTRELLTLVSVAVLCAVLAFLVYQYLSLSKTLHDNDMAVLAQFDSLRGEVKQVTGALQEFQKDGGVQSRHIAGGALKPEHFDVGSLSLDKFSENDIDQFKSDLAKALTTGVITSKHIANGAIKAEHFEAGSISLDKLAKRENQASAGIGGLALSKRCDTFFKNSEQFQRVDEFSVKLVTKGGPVLIGLVPDLPARKDGESPKDIGVYSFINMQPERSYFQFRVMRKAQVVSQFAWYAVGPTPASAIQAIDTPPAGPHEYTLHLRLVYPQQTLKFNDVRLFAVEL